MREWVDLYSDRCPVLRVVDYPGGPKAEYVRRHILWTRGEVLAEMDGDFPLLSRVAETHTQDVLTILRDQSSLGKVTLVEGLIKRRWLGIGELATEELHALEDFDRKWQAINADRAKAAQFIPRPEGGGKKLSKRTIREALLRWLRPRFGKDPVSLWSRNTLRYETNVGEWVIHTDIGLDEPHYQIEIFNAVKSEEGLELTSRDGALLWLASYWDSIVDTTLEDACEVIAITCDKFYLALPNLLDGITPEMLRSYAPVPRKFDRPLLSEQQ